MLLARREQWLTPTVDGVRDRGFRCKARCATLQNTDDVQLSRPNIETYGKIDILINNAGVTWGHPSKEHSLEKWNMVLQINLNRRVSLLATSRREMLKRRSGNIINVASIAGLVGSMERAST